MPGILPDGATAVRAMTSEMTQPLRASQGPGPVVAIGASAGGLDACRNLVRGLPRTTGMSFILVQHLDPSHDSMLVELLGGHTSLAVRQAAEGMAVEPEHLYVIPPGTSLTVANGTLHLSQPEAPHGLRLPFDILLHSMADEYGPRAVCVVLSGTGGDGSLGLRSVNAKGGLVIAQDPTEASYAGMPKSAIATGLVDLVLPVAEIPAAILHHRNMPRTDQPDRSTDAPSPAAAILAAVIELLRTRTNHDFTLYKQGTLLRRIERRMANAGIAAGKPDRYVELLRRDEKELDQLAKDLLINVTSFFRDPDVFAYVAENIIPELVSGATADRPLRIWIAGCSTGEETYSLAMLFREAITAAKVNVKLQVFGSDVDPDAVAVAREGLYSEAIASTVSPERLARFFSKDEHGYRVSPDLRSAVVFTVQDVLADPPFSRLDMVSCRNLLIYLGSVAQNKVISLFHFALRERGILLLGSAETVNTTDGLFEVLSKPERLYRQVGNNRPGEMHFALGRSQPPVSSVSPPLAPSPSRHSELAELCRRLVLDSYAPAAVLVNRKNESLYSLGRTDRYLTVAPGHPSHDILSMARPGIRTKLRAAIQQATQTSARALVAGGSVDGDPKAGTFGIEVRPVTHAGEQLMLICFIEDKTGSGGADRRVALTDVPRVAQLELELEGTRAELQSAIRNLEMSAEEQKIINEEALSFNEEYQSTNEELLTSKEEMQSLNEELTALNGQLQETLERQRTTSNDLKNVLYSTDVATLFLDTQLDIRFFTPATRSLFNVIPGDIGRPLSDLHSLSIDGELLNDAQSVLRDFLPVEREIKTESGAWYVRRILPYRTQDNGVEGVVITFSDITERRLAADALKAATGEADLANMAKSRFLAAASHDLRQPLQTLALIQGLLAKTVEGEKAKKLVARLEDTLGAMSGMLNALLDINQIDAGVVRADPVDFPVGDLIDRITDEFAYPAQAKRLELRAVRSSAWIHSDPRLLEQILRNLLANALKYTESGKVLIGCIRSRGALRIGVWDTGIGIPDSQIEAIFDEYHQLDNEAREHARGLGLGLSIVKRLGELLGHRIVAKSLPGQGSVFTVEVPLARRKVAAAPRSRAEAATASAPRRGAILVVEDDPQVRGLLEMFLNDEGHRTASAHDGAAALDLMTSGVMRPDVILADYNLPNGMDGLQVVTLLRDQLRSPVPVVILTGDISGETLRRIAEENCIQVHKPVKLGELTQIIQTLLPAVPAETALPQARRTEEVSGQDKATIFVVDDDSRIREAIRNVFEDGGWPVETYPTSEAFLAAYRAGSAGCLLIDAYLPGMTGLELLQSLHSSGNRIPAIMVTRNGDVSMAVRAMKAGASDFIEKPIGMEHLIASVELALEQSRDTGRMIARRDLAASHVSDLTPRQREIMDLVLAGHPSKNIAADLGISQRTVENHRASIMRKTGSKSPPALARLAVAAAWNEPGT
jgi:two-component system CheB/CheR fusion protein